MAGTRPKPKPKPKPNPFTTSLATLWTGLGSLVVVLGGVFIVVALHQPMGLGMQPLPEDYGFFSPSVRVPAHNARVRAAMERLGEGVLAGPEDLAYDAEDGFIYTGCYDGWIKRVWMVDGGVAVENWTYVGGRPLGVALAPDKRLVVAEPEKGLMLVKGPGKVELLTDEAEGIKCGLVDGVDVASDGTIYFSDATCKYNFETLSLEILEGRPHGRLLSFNPSSGETLVLARDLYFANGVSLSPDENSVIVCESVMRRCKRYHIKGEKKGTVDLFVENLPGFPDNIRYDVEGHYWIALGSGRTLLWDLHMRYPILRKMFVFLGKFVTIPGFHKGAGALSVSLEGQPLALYSDPSLDSLTTSLRLGKYLYLSSYDQTYFSRIDLTKHAAGAT